MQSIKKYLFVYNQKEMVVRWCKLMKKILFILVFIVVFFISSNIKTIRVSGNVDYFSEILKNTKGKVVEYGVSTSFIASDNFFEKSYGVLKKLDVKENESKLEKNEDNYTIDFESGNISGDFISLQEGDHYVITISLVKKDSSINLNELKHNICKAVGSKNGTLKFYEYLKIALSDGNMKYMNNKICRYLKSNGAVNINTIEINDGFSTIAYTKAFDLFKDNDNKPYDFNFALCSYSSGEYLILGTPEIIISY